MPGKLVKSDGSVPVQRRPVSSNTVWDKDVTPKGLAESLRQIAKAINALQISQELPFTEFEKNVGTSGAEVRCFHGFGKPVRYSVVYWTRQVGGSYPTTAPILVAQATSTSSELVLKSYVSGRAIIRVEPAEVGIEP